MCARYIANQTSKTKNICLGELSESYCALRITRQEPVVLNTDPAGPPPPSVRNAILSLEKLQCASLSSLPSLPLPFSPWRPRQMQS
jgi:hypothetical protein